MRIMVFLHVPMDGCALYRLIYPYQELKDKYGVEVTFKTGRIELSFEEVEQHDIFVLHKGQYGHSRLIEKLRIHKKIVVVDVDDHYDIPEYHMLYKEYRKNQILEKTKTCIILANYITTTTDYLKDQLIGLNKNTVVFPNSLPIEKYNIEIDYTGAKVGYLGSLCHLNDIEILKGLNYTLNKFVPNTELHLFGYREDNVSDKYLSILTNNKTAVKNLLLHKPEPIESYYSLYKYINISLAPLVDDWFNSAKSELKFVESGLLKIPLICSNVMPYNTLTNALLCKDKKDFIEYIKMFAAHPELILEYGERAYKECNEKFNFDKILKDRYDWLGMIFEKGK